jgi:hypothetical protein
MSKPDLDWISIHVIVQAQKIHNYLFSHSVKHALDSNLRGWIFFFASHELDRVLIDYIFWGELFAQNMQKLSVVRHLTIRAI